MVSGALADYIPRAGTTVPSGAGGEADDQREQILGAVTLDGDLRITSCNLNAAPFAGVSVAPGTAFADLLPPGTCPR